MDYEKAVKLLNEYGYTLDCWSPFEISNENNDRATGEFAELILDLIEKKEKKEKNFLAKRKNHNGL